MMKQADAEEGTEGEEGGEATESSEASESTEGGEEENNENADQQSDDANSDQDITEVVLLEQDLEFLPDVWYRVVIEFEQYKFKVYVNQEF